MTPEEKKAWLSKGATPEPVPAPPEPADVKPAASVAPTASTPVAPKPKPKPAPKPKPPPAPPAPPAPTPEQAKVVEQVLPELPPLKPDPEAVEKYEAAKDATATTAIEEAPGMLKRLGALVTPALAAGVKYLPGLPAKLLAPEAEKAAESWATEKRAEIKEEDTAKAKEDEAKAEVARKALLVPEPALALARSLDAAAGDRDPNKQFIDKRSQQILNISLEQAGGPDAVLDGPTYDRMVRDARRQAVEELTRLYIRRQWTHAVGPEDLNKGGNPTWVDAFAPKREFTTDAEGGVQTIHTESLPGWFVNVPLSVLDYAATAAVQNADMDETRDFSERFFENVKDRKDLVTFRIEADSEMQADLASGDTERINRALLTLSPWLGMTILTPSPVEGVTAASAAFRATRNAGNIAADLKALPKSGWAAYLNNITERAAEMDRAAKQAVAEGKTADKVLAFSQEYRVDGNLERAAKNADPDVAEMARNDFAAAMQADPDVAAYLREANRGSPPDPRDAPVIPFGPEEQARLEAIQTELADLSAKRKAAPDYAAIEPLDAQLNELRAERKRLSELQEAKAGEAKFPKVYKDTADRVVADLEEMAQGGKRPNRYASDYVPPEAPVRPTVDAAKVQSTLGADNPPLAESIARAASSDDLLQVLARADAAEREAVARRLGYASYAELKARSRTIAQASVDKLQAKLDTAKNDLATAQANVDAGTIPPEVDAAFERANKAQDTLDASKVNAKTRAKRQAQVDKLFADARTLESAALDANDAALSAAQKAYASADKALQKKMTAVAKAAPINAEVMQRLDAARGDFEDVARQLRAAEDFDKTARKTARAAPPTDPLVLLAGDRETLMNDLSVLNRNRYEATRESVNRVVSNVFEFFQDHVWNPWRQVEEQSLTESARRVRRVLDGEVAEVGARLTRAFASGTKDAHNPAAIAAVAEEINDFRYSVLERGTPSEFFAMVAGAFIQPSVRLNPERARELAQVVADWAADPDADLMALRTALLEKSREVVGGDGSLLVPEGLGDTFLAAGVGYGGAARRAMVSEATLFVTPEAAQEINAIFHRPYVGVGGNPTASRGIRRLAQGIVDPHAYVAPKGTLKGVLKGGVPDEAQMPYAPAFTAGRIPTPDGDMDLLSDIMDVADKMFTREVYVPRAVRDNFLKYAEAAVATRRLSERMTVLEGVKDFWKQAAILGVGLSNPGQGWLDHMGDLMQTATRYPWVAAKTAWRSTPGQLLHTKGVAQVTRLVDLFRGKQAGETATQLDRVLAKITLSPDIDRILSGTNEVVGNTGLTGAELLRLFRQEAVLENFYSSQLTRTVASMASVDVPPKARTVIGAAQGAGAGMILGGVPGGVAGAITGAIFGRSNKVNEVLEANRDAMLHLANAAANRRRAAIVYGLIEEGMDPVKACQEGTRLFGDFAGELSPWLRDTVAVVYPFLSYRKFNTRRTMQALANPFWMKALANVYEHGGEAANAYAQAFFSSEDEYGFHTGSMEFEPDPVELNKLMGIIEDENPDMPLEGVWAKTLADPRYATLPRAIDRYKVIKAKLDSMPYPEAKRAIISLFNGAEDDLGMAAMQGAYWAPDPAKHMLPSWAQDRTALFLNKHRAQITMSYYYAGEGKKARAGDETRYMLAPPDPNVDGLAMMLLAPAMLVDPDGTAGEDLLGIVTRDPLMASLLDLIGALPQDSIVDTPIPTDVGVNLLPLARYGVIKVSDKNDMGVDPKDSSFDPMKAHYSINGKWNAGLHALPFVSAAWLSALEIARAKTALAGGENFREAPDVVDDFGTYSWFVTGNMTKVRNLSPTTAAVGEKYDALDRIKSLVSEMGMVPEPRVEQTTLRQREWSRLVAKDPKNWMTNARTVVERVRADKGRYGDEDVAYMRLYLVLRGEDPKVVGALPTQVLVSQILKSD